MIAVWRDWLKRGRAVLATLLRTPDAPEPPGYSSPNPEFDADGYRIFRTRHDVVAVADELDEVLGPLSPKDAAMHKGQVEALLVGLAGWKTSLLMESLGVVERIRPVISMEDLKNTCVFILVDHSGSMRKQPILLAAGAVEALVTHLRALKVGVEVAGFTTVRWLGGRSRADWIAAGKPPHPGRLNDVLYVVYTPNGPADQRPLELGPMLRPDILKENIDGEALQWAASRLTASPYRHKVLLVISDGAPVDDSTLSVNPSAYLHDHLRRVAATIDADPDLTLGAIGIGHEVSSYYRHALEIEGPGMLGKALLEFCAELLLAATTKGVQQDGQD